MACASHSGCTFLAGSWYWVVARAGPWIGNGPIRRNAGVNHGQLKGAAPPAEGYPAGMPFAIHHHCLVEAGIHQIQNAKLDELARERVWLSCTIILPLRVRGGCGSLTRPIAIGCPSAA